MEILETISLLFLAIWLLYSGLNPFVAIQFPNQNLVIGIFSVITGLLLLARLRESKPHHAIGMLLFTLWFVLKGILPIFAPDLPGTVVLLGIFAAIAGLSFMTMIIDERSFLTTGMLLVGVYLIGSQFLPAVGLAIPFGYAIFAGVAILAGIFLLLGF